MHRRSGGTKLGAVAACALLGGCRPAPSAAPDAGPAPASPDVAALAASLHPGPGEGRPGNDHAPLPCRAIAVEGRAALGAEADAGALRAEQTFPDAWVTLGDKARLVGKDPRTARETTFYGPGLVRDCVGAAEEAWLALGSFESTAGAGEAPGAEEWVVTPQAVVRYAAAKLRVGVRPKGTTVTMVAGVAFLWPPAATGGAALDEGWQRLPAGDTTVAAPPGAAGTVGVGAAVERCTALAAHARDLTEALFSAEGGAPGPAAVTTQVTTRRLARAACAVAAVRVRSAPGLDADAGGGPWLARLADADAAWRALPVVKGLGASGVPR